MSKELIEITPEAVKNAYAVLGISLEESISKGEESTIEKAEEVEEEEEKEEKEEKPEVKEKKKDKKIEKAFEKLSKGLDAKFDALVTINKGLSDQLAQTNEELKKAQDQIKEFDGAYERKSITTKNYIEKAFEENQETGKKMLSIGQHRNQIQRLLIEKAGFDGDVIEKSNVNDFWKNEMEYFEATGGLHIRAIEELYTKDNIQLVK